MYGMINSMILPEVFTNALSYEELIQQLDKEIKLSNVTRLSIKRGMSDIVRGIDLQGGAEVIFISEGVTGEEVLKALEIEDSSEASYGLTDSYYNNKLPKDCQYVVCFGDQLSVTSEDESEVTNYVLMEDDSSKSTCTDIGIKENNSIIKSVDNINKVITVVEPEEGLIASEILALLESTDGSIQRYDVQGIEPIFDDALITKHNNFDLVTESEEIIVISENKHNLTRFKIEIVK